MDKKTELSTVPGEIEDLIISELHPSAAIALSGTNRHFHASVSLHRLDPATVQKYLHEIEMLPEYSDSYACYTCLRILPETRFTVKHTKRKLGKNGFGWSRRACVNCCEEIGRFAPGSIVHFVGEASPKVVCFTCCKIQARFCCTCKFCDSCAQKKVAVAFRKGKEWENNQPLFRSNCVDHEWNPPPGKSWNEAEYFKSIWPANPLHCFTDEISDSGLYDDPTA